MHHALPARSNSLADALLSDDKLFRRFVELANDVVYAMDLQWQLQYVSPKWSDVFGSDPADVIGKSYVPLIHPDDLPRCELALERTVKLGLQQNDIEYRVRHANGQWQHQSSNIAPLLDAEGQLIGVLGIGRDMNERKRQQAALEETHNTLAKANQSLEMANAELTRHRQHLESIVLERTHNLAAARSEAESANAVKTRFMSNVSHEMRTPLQGILGYAEVGKIRSDDATPDELASYFDSILRAGQQMHHLVEGLLTLANKSWDEHAGLSQESRQEIDVINFAHSMATLARLRAEKLGQQLAVDIQIPTLCMVGDLPRLQQVFNHLLGNAFRYSATGSTTLWRVRGTSLDTKPGISFEIIDQGCGIPESEIKAVFEPFYESSRTASGAGSTGLGLPLSHCIVARHDGTIALTNRPEGGLNCQVILPVLASISTPPLA